MLKTAVVAVSLTALSSGAFAADIVNSPVPVAPAAAATTWAGPYIGANLAYAWGSTDNLLNLLAGGALGTGGSIGLSGWGAGAQGGYNWETGNGVVFGLQGDIDWANETGGTTFTISSPGGPNIISVNNTVNWNGAVTGHVGYSFGNLLPYALAGLAFASESASLTENISGTGIISVSDTENHVGFTVGAGVETYLANNLTGFVEARYSNYGTANYTFSRTSGGTTTTFQEGLGLSDTAVRAGLNYHF